MSMYPENEVQCLTQIDSFIVICFCLCVWLVCLFVLYFHHKNQRTKLGRQVYLLPRERAFSLSDLRAGASYVWLEQLTSHVGSLPVQPHFSCESPPRSMGPD